MKGINTAEVFKNIKKHRGERFAKILREAELLDVPNIEHILEFAQLEDLERLVPAIRSKCKIMSVSRYDTDKTPLELLDEAGYDAFIVETEKQKDSIKKYYRRGEELCTFGDPNRHKNFYIIHAVKGGADKIKPSKKPEREDEYGTSVISIQIAKGGGFISIKNRYNHTVNNPDATFGNNPDNIIPGLTNSLMKFFGVEFNVSDVKMPSNYVWVNDQLVHYNYEKYNVYFGDNYYFTGGTITRLNTGYETMLDYMIYNAKDKTVSTPIGDTSCALSIFEEALNGKKVEKTFDKKKNETTLTTLDGNRIVVSGGQIIELSLPNVKVIGNNFLGTNESLNSINLPNVEKIGDYFLNNNEALTSINLPEVKEIGYAFLTQNKQLTSIDLPNVQEIGGDFLHYNEALTSITLPSAKKIGNLFLRYNDKLTSVNLPNVEEIGEFFLEDNESLTSIDLPKVERIGGYFLYENRLLKSINLPNVKEIDTKFLGLNKTLTSIDFPKIEKIDDFFLYSNNSLTSVNLPEKYNWLAEKLLAQNNSKAKKLKNAMKKVLKMIKPRTKDEHIPDNTR